MTALRLSRKTAVLVSAVAVACGGSHGAALAAPEKARPADSFVETIGVGSRFDWIHKDKRLDRAKDALRRLGIRYIRVGYLPEGSDPVRYTNDVKQMALDLKIKICLSWGWDPRPRMVEAFGRWTSGVHPVYALEGINEGFERADWAAPEWENALQVQQLLWELGRPKNLDLYSWSLGGPAGFYWGMPREADRFTTHANVHPYHWYANPHGRGNTKMNGLWQNTETPENAGAIAAVRDAWMRNPRKPVVSTEFGWGLDTLKGNYVGVSEEVQAKYLMRALLENFNAGLERGFLYSLFPHNDDFGIAGRDGTLRPSGRAIAALISLIGERGSAGIATGSLNYTLRVDSGMRTTDNRDLRDDEIHHTLLQKRNRRFLLILWSDKDSQLGETGTEDAVLILPAGAKSVRIFKPLTDGIRTVLTLKTVAPGGRVRLTGSAAIPDHPLVVEIENAR